MKKMKFLMHSFKFHSLKNSLKMVLNNFAHRRIWQQSLLHVFCDIVSRLCMAYIAHSYTNGFCISTTHRFNDNISITNIIIWICIWAIEWSGHNSNSFIIIIIIVGWYQRGCYPSLPPDCIWILCWTGCRPSDWIY